MSGCIATALTTTENTASATAQPRVTRHGEADHARTDDQHLGDRARDRAAVPRLG